MAGKKHHSSSPSRFFKGVRLFLTSNRNSNNNNQLDQKQSYQYQDNTTNNYAVTLTTEVNALNSNNNITLLNPNQLQFMPCQPTTSSMLLLQEKAYVHYEPKKAQVCLGTTNPATALKHNKNMIYLTVEQYAWLIQQLKEEQSVYQHLQTHFQKPITLKQPHMLGIMNYSMYPTNITTKQSIGKRFIRYVKRHQKEQQNNSLVTPTNRILFMLPKTLLLQAAAYIPMTKPLPPPLSPVNLHILQDKPYESLPDPYYLKLKRYCRFVKLCTHELLIEQPTQIEEQEPSPPSSLLNATKPNDFITLPIHCADCPVTTGLETVIQIPKKQPSSSLTTTNFQSIMFPISFVPYNTLLLNNQFSDTVQDKRMSSAIQPTTYNKRVLFDSIAKRQKPHAFSAFQYIPPDRTRSSSSISSISEYSGIEEEDEDILEEENEEDEEEDDCAPQKYGYVAVDNENEEILVVFPGMAMSHHMFENASFAAVPWLEIETITSIPPGSNQPKVEEPWVLDCALTAWHRCELKVVTLLMRLCGTMPSHYKVVIIGYSLGGGIVN
jgi:hypothetical protein